MVEIKNFCGSSRGDVFPVPQIETTEDFRNMVKRGKMIANVRQDAGQEWVNSAEFKLRVTENIAKEIIETRRAIGEPISREVAYLIAKEEVEASKAVNEGVSR